MLKNDQMVEKTNSSRGRSVPPSVLYIDTMAVLVGVSVGEEARRRLGGAEKGALRMDGDTLKKELETYDKQKEEKDDELLQAIIVGEAVKKDGMSGPILQVMLFQYFAADIIMRERDREDWVTCVMKPERAVNYFPSPPAVLRVFFEDFEN